MPNISIFDAKTPTTKVLTVDNIRKSSEDLNQWLSLKGTVFAANDYPKSQFRSKSEALESEILMVQGDLFEQNFLKLCHDLEEVLRFIRKIMQAERLNLAMCKFEVLGLSSEDLANQVSFHQKHLAMQNFAISYKLPKAFLLLNKLRVKTEEVQLAAYLAFQPENAEDLGVGGDLLLALQQLADLFFILMFRVYTHYYHN